MCATPAATPRERLFTMELKLSHNVPFSFMSVEIGVRTLTSGVKIGTKTGVPTTLGLLEISRSA